MAAQAQSGIKVEATLKDNRPNRKPRYDVQSEGIVGTLYLGERNEDEPREVPDSFHITVPRMAVEA